MSRWPAEVVEAAIGLPDRRIAVCGAESPSALAAAERARRIGLTDSILIGDAAAIVARLRALGADPAHFEILDAPGPADAAASAVAQVREGRADALMKGGTDTAALMHAVLDHDRGIRAAALLSHVAVLQLARYPKPLAITDGGVTIAPDLAAKAEIVRNAVRVTRALGVRRAKVAALAAKEKVTAAMPATVDAAALASQSFDGAVVDGPLALDNAIDPHSARLKGIVSEVAGDADVLLAPDIETGNLLGKALQYLGGARLAGLVVGARVPIVLTSRADDDRCRLDSLALALLIARV